MKKLASIVMLAASITAAVAAFAEEKCSSVSDAKKLMAVNRQPDAIACLDNLKTDVEANYLLGTIYFQSGNRQAAKERLSAPAVKNAKGGDIYQLYKSAGDSLANQKNFEEAGSMYEEAFSYKADARQSIARDMFERGKSSGERGYSTVAKRLDKSLAGEIGQYYHAQSLTKKTAAEQIQCLEFASADDPKFKKELLQKKEAEGRGALEQAKVFAKKPGHEADTAKFKAIAQGYLGPAVVEKELPEVKVFDKGTYTFSLKAGEQTPYWIMFRMGGRYGVSSSDDKFKLVFDDGEESLAWTPGSFPNKTTAKFRIVAVTDQTEIKMVLK